MTNGIHSNRQGFLGCARNDKTFKSIVNAKLKLRPPAKMRAIIRTQAAAEPIPRPCSRADENALSLTLSE